MLDKIKRLRTQFDGVMDNLGKLLTLQSQFNPGFVPKSLYTRKNMLQGEVQGIVLSLKTMVTDWSIVDETIRHKTMELGMHIDTTLEAFQENAMEAKSVRIGNIFKQKSSFNF
jgi:hypothetical protein|tara:strand:- start:105 stop:443 length:339 start_codon:yes stop_codon:yes gene_type:complete